MESEKDKTSSSSNANSSDGLYVQDVGFSVQISVPGIEQFPIQVEVYTDTQCTEYPNG